MTDVIDISSSSSNEVVAKFKAYLSTSEHGQIDNSKPGYTKKCRRQDTVDGNPGAATKQCYPYRQSASTMGVNGPKGGRSGYGLFGD